MEGIEKQYRDKNGLPSCYTLLLSSLFILAILLFSKTNGHAQGYDLILKKDSTTIDCNILLVTEHIIKYKKTPVSQGPIFHILTSTVAKVIYQNGNTVDLNLITQPTKTVKKQTPRYPQGPWLERSFTLDLAERKPSELTSAYKFYNAKAKSNKTMCIAVGAIGTLLAVKGASMFINAKQRTPNGYQIIQGERYMGSVMFVAGSGSGFGLGTLGLVRSRKYRNKAKVVEREISDRRIAQTRLFLTPQYSPAVSSLSFSFIVNF